jgi:glycosyltransferase involved in cell wall biosynthesis
MPFLTQKMPPQLEEHGRMRILRAHNFYQQPGGEDRAFAAEVNLLRDRGHQVFVYTVHNHKITHMTRSQLALQTIWNSDTYRRVRTVIREHQIQIVQCDNTFPLISPAVYYAAKAESVAVVQTLHNYRLFCLNAYFFRNGQVCEDCLSQPFAWRGALRACYRQSFEASWVSAGMLALHRILGTWQKQVDTYIALSQFSLDKFIEGGLPKERLVKKPNFISPDPGFSPETGSFALFVGRLSPEKGLFSLLRAWEALGEIPLKIVGDGPLLKEAQAWVTNRKINAVQFLGHQDRDHLYTIIKNARFLVFPSNWFECLPVTIIEAFACGVPVLASRLGAMKEIVTDGRTGLHFKPGDPNDLAEKVDWAWAHPGQLAEMGLQARKEYEENYTAEHNYRRLMNIYIRAMTKTKCGK